MPLSAVQEEIKLAQAEAKALQAQLDARDKREVQEFQEAQDRKADRKNLRAHSVKIGRGRPGFAAANRPPTTYLLKFLSGENSAVEEDLTQYAALPLPCVSTASAAYAAPLLAARRYAEALSSAGFRNKILLKQLTKKDLVRFWGGGAVNMPTLPLLPDWNIC